MRNSIKSIIDKLTSVQESVEGYLATAESSEYPNEERIDKLQSELESIESAIEALQEIE